MLTNQQSCAQFTAQTVVNTRVNQTPISKSAVKQSDLIKLHLQRFFGRLAVLPLGLIIVLIIHLRFHFKLAGLQDIRRRFKEIAKRGKPLMICANHLTMVDSVILIWALASMPYYFLHYKFLCWNIPAVENYSRKPLWKFITYLSKCIPIDRQGTDEHKEEVLEKLRYFMRRGDFCMVFPEGTRSRSGKIDPEHVGYGVGRIILGVPDCEVLCIYLRGKGQDSYSTFPKIGEEFHFDMQLIKPTSNDTGRRAIRDFSVQTITKLKEMEDAYFARERHS